MAQWQAGQALIRLCEEDLVVVYPIGKVKGSRREVKQIHLVDHELNQERDRLTVGLKSSEPVTDRQLIAR